MDSANLPSFDTARLEGRIERPIGARVFQGLGAVLLLIGFLFSAQLFNLQVLGHDALANRAEANRLHHTTVIAERGLIVDRNGVALAENVEGEDDGMVRSYPFGYATSQIVGYVSYPKRDQNGFWYQDQTEGVFGVELQHDDALNGENGLEIAETNATGDAVSGSVVRVAEPGKDIALSLDAGLQSAMYEAIKRRSDESGWRGGGGVIMDIETGELLAVASYPSFDPEIMSVGSPQETVEKFLSDSRSPFLDRVVSGLYTPGSVVKPFMATAALEEHLIDPLKNILSTGSISVPNPYDPTKATIFKDWKAHGYVDMRHALAVSSDVYFYAIGGGWQDQAGLGIATIDKYMKLFGMGALTGVPLQGEESGVIPTPEWKAEQFDGERWFLGNTYHTSIGQYGFQLTPIQIVRATASIANGGNLVTPTILKNDVGEKKPLGVSNDNLQIVREGMRLAVTEGTAQSLAVPGIRVAGKTGTAEVGVRKEFTNSFLIGFFPYEKPKYAFAVVMERAKAGTLQGAPATMREVLEWVVAERPEMASQDLVDSMP